MDNNCYRLGLDVGSTTAKIVILDPRGEVAFCDYRRHQADIDGVVSGLLHDAAATSEAALAQAIPLDAASAQPVADPAVLATVTANYDACRENADRLIAWQQRYLQLEQAP